jgi:class 3 adenylate cyclase
MAGGETTYTVRDENQFLADHIPSAELVDLTRTGHLPWTGDAAAGEIQEFITGSRFESEPDRVLATVLFTDIVDSTQKAAELGDRKWKELLEDHHADVRRLLERFRGQEIDMAGDGLLATFDGPGRGIRCASHIVKVVKRLGLEARAGLHTGEVELVGNGVRGIAVHIGARVCGRADAGEILVSSTVKDLVAGSDHEFRDRGEHELKGVPDRWRLYALV